MPFVASRMKPCIGSSTPARRRTPALLKNLEYYRLSVTSSGSGAGLPAGGCQEGSEAVVERTAVLLLLAIVIGERRTANERVGRASRVLRHSAATMATCPGPQKT